MPMPWSQVHTIAATEAGRAHRELGINLEQVVDPIAALHASGLPVLRRRLDRLAGAYLTGDIVDGSAGVLINVAHPLTKQRFTAAHELCHHRRDRHIALDEDTEWLSRGENGASDRERIAEAFASWFLMPKPLVMRKLRALAGCGRTPI